MQEVISFSCSDASGHLVTQLYNVQESHIPYTKSKRLEHQNDVFLWPVRANGKANYYPRSINVEYSGGYGFLSKYEYHERKVDTLSLKNVVVTAKDRVKKNEFQQILDTGAAPDSSLLDEGNTAYWTDYNKLIYRPSSLLEVKTFMHPDGENKHFKRQTFSDYPKGESEFKELQDDIEDTFRKSLEALDNIQGVNFFSETDNGWGGFTNELIVTLKDEYFNNGVNSKYNLWCYGLLGAEAKRESMLTRIRSFVEFSKNSTLFFPLLLEDQSSSLLNDSFDIANKWHRGAVQSMFVNSLWSLNCQAENPVRMAEIEANLVGGYSKRTVVNEIYIKKNEETTDGNVADVADYGFVSMNPEDMYGFAQEQKKPTEIRLGMTADEKAKVLSHAKVLPNAEDGQEAYVSPSMNEITDLDTFPQILTTSDLHTEFAQTVALRNTIKGYRKIIERVRAPAHLELIGDRGELIEDLSLLLEEYTVGYQSESDSDE